MRRKKWLELGKDVLIVLLALTVVVLTILALPAKTVTDTPWLAAIVRPFASVMGLSQAELTYTPLADAGSVTGAAQPIYISVRNPAGRTSFQADFDALDSAFEQFGAALGQALETAQEPQYASAAALHAALGKTSVAFCYPGELSSALVASWLNAATTVAEHAKWFVLSAEDTAASLYLVSDKTYVCQTQLEAESLEQLLQSCTPDGSFFAFEDTTGRYSGIAPMSLLPAQTPQLLAAETANPCDARFSDALAAQLGFNPYGDARYADDAGNITYTETGYALSVSAQGLLRLKSEAQVSRFQAASTQQADLVECARALLASMASGALADARLYLTDVRQDGTQTVCTFDYFLNALPVTLTDGHAAEVRFSGTSILLAQLKLKSYTLGTQTLAVLPAAQAASIVQSGRELRLVYSDSSSGVTAGWQS